MFIAISFVSELFLTNFYPSNSRSPRKAQQNGNSNNKRVKYANSKVKQEPFVKQEESEEDDDDEGNDRF